jgi:hypothetical protein
MVDTNGHWVDPESGRSSYVHNLIESGYEHCMELGWFYSELQAPATHEFPCTIYWTLVTTVLFHQDTPTTMAGPNNTPSPTLRRLHSQVQGGTGTGPADSGSFSPP